MYEKEKRELLTYAGKTLIELSGLERSEKEILLSVVDYVYEFRKMVDAIEKAELERFQKTAQCYGLDRIVLFPYPMESGCIFLFKMYGGDIASFCHCCGIVQLPQEELSNGSSRMTELEQKYGIVLYTRGM